MVHRFNTKKSGEVDTLNKYEVLVRRKTVDATWIRAFENVPEARKDKTFPFPVELADRTKIVLPGDIVLDKSAPFGSGEVCPLEGLSFGGGGGHCCSMLRIVWSKLWVIVCETFVIQ